MAQNKDRQPYGTLEFHDVFGWAAQYPTPISPRIQRPVVAPQRLGNLEAVPAEHLPWREIGNLQTVPGRNEDPWPEPIYEVSNDTSRSANSVGKPSSDENAPKKILGLYRGHFLLLTSLITLVLAGAVLGGVLGTQLMKEDTPPQPTPSSTSNVSVLNTSRLAASNWTGSDQTLHKSVFFQYTNEHIIVRQWDSSSDTWQTTDITAQILAIDASAPQPTRGSTLASSTEIAPGDSTATETVFFYDADNVVQAYSTAGSTEWSVDDLNGWHGIGYANSELAATEQYIGGATYVLLAYQDSDGEINVYNMSAEGPSWSTTLASPRSGTGQRPTPMTMAPFYHRMGEAVCLGLQNEVYNLDLKHRNLTSIPDISGSGSFDSFDSWVDDHKSELLQGLESESDMLLQHAAVSGLAEWGKRMWFVRATNGSILGSWEYDVTVDWARSKGQKGSGTPQQMVLSFDDEGAEQGWQSIAAANGGLFFGITKGGEIREYSVDEANPNVLTNGSVVYSW